MGDEVKAMADHDPYRCRWCQRPDVVPSLVAEHERVCVARPSEDT